MAFLNRQEFAKRCGLPTNALSVYVSRGKVVYSGEFIDDSIEPNKTFLAKRIDKNADQVEITEGPEIVKTENSNTTPPKIKKATGDASFLVLEKRLKGLDADKREKEIEKLELQIAKLNGESIPTELAKMVIVQLSKSYMTAMVQNNESIITEMAAIKGFSSKEVAELRGKNIKTVNKFNDKVLTESKKMIESIVNKYSDTRGKGERN